MTTGQMNPRNVLLTTVVMTSLAVAAFEQTFTIREPFGLDWGPDRVNYAVEFPEGVVRPDGVALTDAAGEPVAVQLSDIELWPDGRSVRTATVSFMVRLQPDETGVWMLTGGDSRVRQPSTDLTVRERRRTVELTTAHTGIRLPAGTRRFRTPVAADAVPAPIQAVRLSDGAWIGRGWWETDRPCLGYTVTVEEGGPVFARVRLRYDFSDDTRYEAVIELSAQQDLAIVNESYDLARDREYEMPELRGRAGRTFRMVEPVFDPPERGMLWDWWGGTGGRVPSPNAHFFSFYNGLEPERCEWNGRMFSLHPGINPHGGPADTPLTFDADGRVISLNAFQNWGQDESFYFAAYGPRRDEQVAIVGLRPSQWLNPDIEPKPVATFSQYTQTGNLWIERRTDPDLFLRVPTMLGRRVYGIGVLQRMPMEQDAEDGGATRSDIHLRHIRHGRQRLDEVKDWVLDYDEPGDYPRLLVEPGDLDELRARARTWLQGDSHPAVTALLRDGDDGRRAVDAAIEQLGNMCRRMATVSYNHNAYAMTLPRLAMLADVALAMPACSPEQAARIRRYVAATAYNALSPDYVPPREAGYAWGSANMMEALRLRGATPMVSLLPHHPGADEWRGFLAHFLRLNAREKINEAGATLEIGAYGVMGIEFATVPTIMLSNADPSLDFSDLLPLWRAAARYRLSYLLPPDVRGGYRAPAPIGDSPYGRENSLPFLMGVLAPRDTQMVRWLMWGIREGGAAMASFGTPPGLLVPTDIEHETPDLRSEHFAGSGFVLRSGFPHPEETYVNLNAGSFAIGHGHPDRHGFILYAKGAPLMLDFASQYQPNIAQSWLHNAMVTFNHREDVRPCPGRDHEDCYFIDKVWIEHTIEPFTSLEAGWPPDAEDLDAAHGHATAFVSTEHADFAAMTRRIDYLERVPYMLNETHGQFLGRGAGEPVWVEPPFDWKRRVVFVKSSDVDAPNYLVIRDDLSGNRDFEPALNYWCLAESLEVAGQTATYTGQHGVDLDIYVAEPAAFTHHTHTVAHAIGREFDRHYRETFGEPFKEEQILLQIPRQPDGGGYFTAVIPRRAGDPSPQFETVADGHAIRVTFADGRVDTVVLMNTPGEIEIEGQRLTGTAFLVTRTADGVETVSELYP